jgi:Tfp pilus assembly pilus retraction ATPase PilT
MDATAQASFRVWRSDVRIKMDTTLTKVKQMTFSDLYLGHPTLGDRFCDGPGAQVNLLPDGAAMQHDIEQLKQACLEAKNRSPSMSEFRVSHDGLVYRAFIMNSLSGQVLVLRKIADDIPSLAELGIPRAYIRHLMDRDLTGLFIVSGTMKAGKTTTACAMIKERLSAYGGVAVTAEDPIELPLEGNHGPGVCYQTLASGTAGGFVEAFRQMMRWGAKTVFVGEITDREIAAEVLQASLNGHLVISTVRAENVIRTIMKMQALANEELDQGAAQTLLADGLLGVLHQKLTRGPKKKLETEFLFLKDAEFARSNIRNGKYEMLASDIKQQMASMIAENAMALRKAGT